MKHLVIVSLTRQVEVELVLEDGENAIDIALELHKNGDCVAQLGDVEAAVVWTKRIKD